MQNKKTAPGRSRTKGTFRNQKAVFTPVSLQHTFKAFVTGKSNRCAFDAAAAAARHPGKQAHNPLVIYGGNGLGKTHLLHAIDNYIRVNRPKIKVIFIPAPVFFDRFINAVRHSQSSHFRKTLLWAEVLLVDDIQFLADRPSSSNELMLIMDSLIQQGKQVIISADCQPSKLKSFSKKIISLCQGGLCVELGLPDIEQRRAIIKKMAKGTRCTLSKDALAHLVKKAKTSVRDLEGIWKLWRR